MSKPITKKQEAVLEFIKSELRSKGYPPSIREICSAVGLTSSSTVHGHLSSLEKKRIYQKRPYKTKGN